MPRLPQLIDAVSQAVHKSQRTVREVATRLTDAGLLSASARGAGASNRSPREAAVLLLAAKTIETASQIEGIEGLLHLRRMAGSLIDPHELCDNEGLSKEMDALREVLLCASGVDALEMLISSLNRIRGALDSAIAFIPENDFVRPDIEIRVFRSNQTFVMGMELVAVARNTARTAQPGFTSLSVHHFIYESHWASNGTPTLREDEHLLGSMNLRDLEFVASIYSGEST
jgi:hypothetical protein